MSVRDTVALLRDLDPVQGHPPRPRLRSRRGGAAQLVAAAATVAAVAIGVVVTTDAGRATGFADAAYAALTAPDSIVHLRLRSEFHFPEDEPATTELWTRAGGRQLRVVYEDGEHEFVRDTDARYAASYVRHRNQLTRFTEPHMWQVLPGEELSFAGPEGAGKLAENLQALLARARDGDPAVQRLPDAELAGRAVARLATTTVIRASDQTQANTPPELNPVAIRTVVWFDLETYLPRRIERFFGGRREATTDVVLGERLELNDATESLLEMPAHRGAKRVVGGGG